MTRKKILVIGANGFTGRRILDDLSHNVFYQTTGCSLHDDICPHSGNYRFIRTDICNRQAVEKLFQEVQPDVVINTSALSVPDYCETHHAEADAVNITAVEHLAECCEAGGSRFIHLSTDFVFGGDTDRPYTEEDIPAPVNYYGYTKLEGEKRIAAVCRDYAIVRVVVVYGAALPGQHGNVLQLVANRLRNNEEVFVVSDQWRTPTFVGDVSQGVEKLINHPQNGIYHLCGSECLTIADNGRIGAESLAHPSRHHEGDERKDTTSPFQRAEYRKGTPGTGVSAAHAGGRNKADVRMVNDAVGW